MMASVIQNSSSRNKILSSKNNVSQRVNINRHIPRRLQHYLDRLELNDPMLTELNLRHHALDEYSYSALINSLRNNRMLKRLYISFTNDENLFESSIQLLSSIPSGVQFLDLDLTVLSPDNLDRVFEALRLQEPSWRVNSESSSSPPSIATITTGVSSITLNGSRGGGTTTTRRRSSLSAPTLIQEICVRFSANDGDSGVASLVNELFLPTTDAATATAETTTTTATTCRDNHDTEDDTDESSFLNDITEHSEAPSILSTTTTLTTLPSIVSSLQILDLRNNRISNLGAVALAEALPHVTKLKELNLSYNNIGDEGICAITTKLKHTEHYSHCSLQRLDLSCNQIGQEGCAGLGTFLKTNRSVTDLNLFCNPNIGLFGSLHLLNALSINDVLQDLHLEGSSCSHLPTLERLTYYLRLNRAGRRIFRTHEWMTSLWPLLLERISDEPDLLWYFVREQPDLVQYAGEHRD